MLAVMPNNGRRGRTPRPSQFSINKLTDVCDAQVSECVQSVAAKLKEKMGKTDLFRSLGMVVPQVFDHFHAEKFDKLLDTLCEHEKNLDTEFGLY